MPYIAMALFHKYVLHVSHCGGFHKMNMLSTLQDHLVPDVKDMVHSSSCTSYIQQDSCIINNIIACLHGSKNVVTIRTIH